MIAALFVEASGVYSGLPAVDLWDEARDARTYPGPWPVVAHPPCQRWGRYWHGGPSSKTRLVKGDDGGCFEAALKAVRTWGGVLEHPRDSHAWARFGLFAPPYGGGWIVADDVGGWTCCLDQGRYAHPARKASWLYVCRLPALPSLLWGHSEGKRRLDLGFRTHEERALFFRPHELGELTPKQLRWRETELARRDPKTGKMRNAPERLTTREKIDTPLPFRDLLIALAESVTR